MSLNKRQLTSTTLEDSKQSIHLSIQDSVTKEIIQIAFPEHVQIGLEQKPSDLILNGRLALTCKTLYLNSSNFKGSTVQLTNNDIVVSIESDSSSGYKHIYLPKYPRNGQLLIIKDSSGTVDSSNYISLSGNGHLIDDSLMKDITTAYGSIILVFIKDKWNIINLYSSSGGGGGAPTNAKYLVVDYDSTLTDERKLAVASALSLTDNGANNTILIDLATQASVTPGSYTNSNITVNSKGIITNISNGTGGSTTHNSLSGLQGGTTNQYYHLTSTEYSKVQNLDSYYSDKEASYIVLNNTASLPNERSLTAGIGLNLTDAGAGSTATLSIDNDIVATVSGTTFSGPVKFNQGLSGSLTTLVDGSSYLKAGSNVIITSASNGSVTISATGTGGATNHNDLLNIQGGTTNEYYHLTSAEYSKVQNLSSSYADVNASYIVIGTTSSLPNERALSSGLGINVSDSGPGSSVSLSINNNVVATVSGTTFSGPVNFSGGLSGSLTTLTDGTSYLKAGSNITITSASNGSVTINSTASSSGSGEVISGFAFPTSQRANSVKSVFSSSYQISSSYNVFTEIVPSTLSLSTSGSAVLLTANLSLYCTGTNTNAAFTIYRDGINIGDPTSGLAIANSAGLANSYAYASIMFVDKPTLGNHTYKLCAVVQTGSSGGYLCRDINSDGQGLPTQFTATELIGCNVTTAEMTSSWSYTEGSLFNVGAVVTPLQFSYTPTRGPVLLLSNFDHASAAGSWSKFAYKRNTTVFGNSAYGLAIIDLGGYAASRHGIIGYIDTVTAASSYTYSFLAATGAGGTNTLGKSLTGTGNIATCQVAAIEFPSSTWKGLEHTTSITITSGSSFVDLSANAPNLGSVITTNGGQILLVVSYDYNPISTADPSQAAFTILRNGENIGSTSEGIMIAQGRNINTSNTVASILWIDDPGPGTYKYSLAARVIGGSGVISEGGEYTSLYAYELQGYPIASGWVDINQTLATTSSVVVGHYTKASNKGSDVFFYVSGTMGLSGSSNAKLSVFGGDVKVSGSLSVNSTTTFSSPVTFNSNTTPLKLTSGSLVSPQQSNSIEYNGTDLYITNQFSNRNRLTNNIRLGTSLLNFSTGLSEVTASVGNLIDIDQSSFVQAYMMTDTTVEKTGKQHRDDLIRLVCGDIVEGSGFTIYASSSIVLSGTYSVRWNVYNQTKFEPMSYPGLAAYYDCDTLGYLLNGSTISTLYDRSFNNDSSRNAVQSTALSQPTLTAIDSEFLNHGTTTFTSAQELDTGTWIMPHKITTDYYVVKLPSTFGVSSYYNLIDGFGTNRHSFSYGPGKTVSMYAGSQVISSAVETNTIAVICAVYNTTNSEIYLNNSTTPIGTGNCGSQTFDKISIGNYLASYPFTGKVACIAIYAGVHSSVMRAEIMKKLGQKYGITVSV